MANLGPGEWIVIGLCLIIGLFFVIGNWINNQRGNDAMLWLRRGLSTFGELKSSRFSVPTSKGVPFQIVPAEQCPFQRIRGSLVLERRENLPLWLFQRLRGKRDTLEWTSDLQSAPMKEFHITSESSLHQVKTEDESSRGNPGEISALPPQILEVAVQRKSPQLTFRVLLSTLLQTDSQAFFQSLQKWIEMN